MRKMKGLMIDEEVDSWMEVSVYTCWPFLLHLSVSNQMFGGGNRDLDFVSAKPTPVAGGGAPSLWNRF
jgi:hypothetical protein